MPQQVRKRPQRTVQYSENNKVSEQLSRGMIYRELYLQLSGQIDDPTNAYATIERGDEWGVIREIALIANNTDVIRRFSANELWWLNYFLYQRAPRVTPAIGDGTTDPSFNSVLILPLWMPTALRPIDTALDARELSDLKIEITWGDHNDVSSTATGWITNPTLKMHSAESFGVQGPFSQWRVFPIEKEITASNPNYEVELPVGPMYRGFLLNTTDGGADAGDIINNVKLVSGTTVYEDMPEEVLEQAMLTRMSVPRGYSGTAYDDLRQSNSSSLDGWYWMDHVMDGYLSEAVDTLGFSEFKLQFDVSVGAGTTKLRVLPQQIIPVRGQQRG